MTDQRFREAVELYGDMVFRLAYSYLKNRADAEDVMQESLLKLYVEPRDFESADHEKHWLIRVAANEWGKDGINVNIICPLAWTAQLENFEAAYPEAFKQNVHMPPMGHYGDTELEIGRVCVQLASPDFKYMSGETITLEGGMGLRP